MNFSKLKELRLRKKFEKTLDIHPEITSISDEVIKTIGILTIDEISSTIDLQKEVEAVFGIRHSKIYSFRTFDKNDPISYKHFSEKDFNWQGAIVQPNIKVFLEHPFDLLIGFFENNNLYLEKAVLESKASFKVGISGVNAKLYSLEIAVKSSQIQPFFKRIKEIFEYS
jgi:hypothetical protein